MFAGIRLRSGSGATLNITQLRDVKTWQRTYQVYGTDSLYICQVPNKSSEELRDYCFVSLILRGFGPLERVNYSSKLMT